MSIIGLEGAPEGTAPTPWDEVVAAHPLMPVKVCAHAGGRHNAPMCLLCVVAAVPRSVRSCVWMIRGRM